MVAHAFHPGTWEAERQADLCMGGQPGLHSEFQDGQGYTEKSCLKNKTQQQKQEEKNPHTNKKEYHHNLSVNEYTNEFQAGRRSGEGAVLFS